MPSTTAVCRIAGMSDTSKKANDLASTIAAAREKKGMNQSELARAVGVSPQAVQKWEAGASVPRPSKLKAIAGVLGINVRSLVPAYIATDDDVLVEVPEGMPPPAGAQRVESADETDQEVDQIPYWDAKGSCGGGFLNYEQMPKGHLVKEASFFKRYHIKPENAVAIYADGNSMANFIVDGDIVIFDRSRTEPRSGKIFLIEHPDGLRIKQLRREIGGAWVLESLNPDKSKYPDERIEPSHGALLKIYGEFVYRQGG